MPPPDRYVIDAAVALAFAWPDVLSPAAVRFFAAVQRGWIQLIAPDVWLLECASACRQKVQRRRCTPEEAIQIYGVIRQLPVTPVDTTDLSDLLIHLALERQLSTYDALYVAVAEFARVPLLTADAGLTAALRDAHWTGHVEHLSEW